MSHSLNPLYDKIVDWPRFRDDIFCIWTGTKEELLDFNNWINSLHPRLKFTMEYSTSSIKETNKLRKQTNFIYTLTEVQKYFNK